LPPGVSLEKMRRLEPQSVLRDPIIVRMFRDLGERFIEQLGTCLRLFPAREEQAALPGPWRPTACHGPISTR
jgi:predicted HTH transcriptional regulator